LIAPAHINLDFAKDIFTKSRCFIAPATRKCISIDFAKGTWKSSRCLIAPSINIYFAKGILNKSRRGLESPTQNRSPEYRRGAIFFKSLAGKMIQMQQGRTLQYTIMPLKSRSE
jgi:hypothetical protein